MATRCLRQSIIISYLELKDPSRRDLGKMGYFTLPGFPPPPTPTAKALLTRSPRQHIGRPGQVDWEVIPLS